MMSFRLSGFRGNDFVPETIEINQQYFQKGGFNRRGLQRIIEGTVHQELILKWENKDNVIQTVTMWITDDTYDHLRNYLR